MKSYEQSNTQLWLNNKNIQHDESSLKDITVLKHLLLESQYAIFVGRACNGVYINAIKF